jgi:parvulin-like peptidyl-prolyl isomerase
MALLEQEAIKHGVQVTDREVADYIRHSPPRDIVENENFKTDGQFDINKYQMWLQQLALSNDPRFHAVLQDLEEQIRDQLLVSRVQDVVLSTVKITEADARRDFVEKNEKVKVRYIFIPAGDYDSTVTTVPESETRARYEKDREQLKQPDMAVLDYVMLAKAASAEDSAAAKAEIYRIYSEAKSGADFAELAMAFSQDPGSGKKGGDLGWFGEGKMVDQFWQATTKLQNEGDISEPFMTQFGWHIIKLTGKKTTKDDKGVEKPEYQASHILITYEPSSETLGKIEQKANNFRLDAEKLGFKAAAEEYGLTVNETKSFMKGTSVPGVGQYQNLNDFAFAGKPGEVSDVISARNGYYVTAINRKIPAGITPFEEVKERLNAQLLREKRIDLAHQRGEELVSELSRGKSLDDVAVMAGKIVQEADYFARSQFVPKVGSDPEFIGSAFGLTPQEPLSKAVRARTGAYIIQYVDRQPADTAVFAAASDSLVSSMIENKRKDAWSKWLNGLKQKARIDDYRTAYYGS